MTTLRVVMGDHLTRGISSLRDIPSEPSEDRDIVLMAELDEEITRVRHHKQKIILVLSAMRHFAASLRDEGIAVDYVLLDDPDNTGSFPGEIRRAAARHKADRIVVTEPSEYAIREMLRRVRTDGDVPVQIRPDDRFLCTAEEFDRWAMGRKELRMEYFYRMMRRETGWLMDGKDPAGGRWNFDADNRRPWPKDLPIPTRLRFEPDEITREVCDLTEKRYAGHFGDPAPFGWAVAREDARRALDHFVAEALPSFGSTQDAMKRSGDFLHHALLSPYLNIGLLTPREVGEAAVAAFETGAAPLSAVEGFIRQVLGWREFIRGIYHRYMPDYAASNYLEAERPLPDFYWTGDTAMACLRETIGSTRRNAYAHHIQRLMVTGNFALLIGARPEEVEEWYLTVYIDAFEWVELPNTHGMALFADGGRLASKPYAASGAYIHRMSDYCTDCRYRPGEKNGPEACPFNYLYWDFMSRHRDRLEKIPRMSLPYRNLDGFTESRRRKIAEDAGRFMADLPGGPKT